MALTEFETKRAEKLANEFRENIRPPAHIRKELDIGTKVENQSVEVFEIRPVWNDPSRIQELPIAKTTFVKMRSNWKIYWQRADLKWHAYEPNPEVTTLEEFFEVVKKDEYACFWG